LDPQDLHSFPTRRSSDLAITTMNKIATPATKPEMGLISVRAISASDFPLRRMLAPRIMKSCTAPPRQTPITNHKRKSLAEIALRSEEHTSELQSHLNLVC